VPELTMDGLLERHRIIDCIYRCARGVDRLDRELVLSGFHPDAVDHHGHFLTSPTQFIGWLWLITNRTYGQQVVVRSTQVGGMRDVQCDQVRER
jgi:hypothetical protein